MNKLTLALALGISLTSMQAHANTGSIRQFCNEVADMKIMSKERYSAEDRAIDHGVNILADIIGDRDPERAMRSAGRAGMRDEASEFRAYKRDKAKRERYFNKCLDDVINSKEKEMTR